MTAVDLDEAVVTQALLVAEDAELSVHPPSGPLSKRGHGDPLVTEATAAGSPRYVHVGIAAGTR